MIKLVEDNPQTNYKKKIGGGYDFSWTTHILGNAPSLGFTRNIAFKNTHIYEALFKENVGTKVAVHTDKVKKKYSAVPTRPPSLPENGGEEKKHEQCDSLIASNTHTGKALCVLVT